VTLSIVAGGVRLASNKNHWEDVAVGFALGAMISVYLVGFHGIEQVSINTHERFQMKGLRSARSAIGSAMTRAGNYDDYQSYIDDNTQFHKDVSHHG
jgi:hypothetical protein